MLFGSSTPRHPVALVIDNFEVVRSTESLDAIAALALGLPIGSQRAIGSGTCCPYPPRACALKVASGKSESTIWRWTRMKQAPMLLEAGVALAGADLDELVHRTEGWPVGLSFLTQTSILDRMCSPLCDAVLGVTAAAVEERRRAPQLI